MPRTVPRPYPQGGLDGLCGVYSIINAVSVAVNNCVALDSAHRGGTRRAIPGAFCRASAAALFFHIVTRLDRDRGLVRALSAGVGDTTVWCLLREAARWVRDNVGFRLIFRRPYLHIPDPTPAAVSATIARHISGVGTVAIVGFDGRKGHWSVVVGVTTTRFRLADSDGVIWLAKGPRRPRHARMDVAQIDPSSVVLLRAAPARRDWRRVEAVIGQLPPAAVGVLARHYGRLSRHRPYPHSGRRARCRPIR